ncbi:MAG: hypothetical protein LUH36_07805 [Oscillospiraceae bacterium]|nr:hypothetical protein [Oscillospiraceae bacterium]
MTSSDYIFLVLCGISAALMALAVFARPIAKPCTVLCLLWMGAALPVMFFMTYAWRYVLLFYLISSAFSLLFLFGGRRP